MCANTVSKKVGYINYMKGANIAGFMKVATAMGEQGIYWIDSFPELIISPRVV